jgi:chromosome partitioning protein
MFRIVIASPKGGSGKSTLAINLAGLLAARKQRVVIMDLDKQQSSLRWLARRPAALPKIVGWREANDLNDVKAFRPRWMVVDTHARLLRADRAQLLSRADVVLVPVSASVFDIEATAVFLRKLQADPHVQSGKVALGLVGARVHGRTKMGKELASFFEKSGLPIVMYVPDSVLYPQCAADGISIFDLPRTRNEQQLDAWQPLTAWLKSQVARATRYDKIQVSAAANVIA